MYEHFYGLKARPFDLAPDPRYLVMTSVHQEALSNLEYAIASHKGVTLLLGEAGTGKTTIIRAAIAKQTGRSHCVHLHNPALSRDEFIRMLAAQFHLSENAHQSKTDMLLEFERMLQRRRLASETTVLIVDEAQAMSLHMLEEIRLLTNIETDSEKLLSLILAGQPEFANRLNEQSFRQLKQRIALRCELRPLTMLESVHYIAKRIEAVGGVPAKIFSREAVQLLHERSNGIPRTINVLADNALLGGFANGEKIVNRRRVLAVCADFDIKQSTHAPTQEPPRPMAPHPTGPLTATELRDLDATIPGPATDRHESMVS